MSTSLVASTLTAPLVRRSPLLWTLTLTVGGAALVALAAQVAIPLPFTPVPITGQTFAVLLVGTALGPIAGSASLALYVLVGLAGLPVYADGAHGLSQLTSASGGYLIGFVLAASITGALATRGWDRSFSSATTAMLTANVVIYLVGLPWLAIVLDTDLSTTLTYGLYPFVVGDLLKIYLAAALLPTAWRITNRRPSADSDDS